MKWIVWAACLAASVTAAEAAEKGTRFWNLTSATVTSLRLSHAGKEAFGDNVAVADEDGVDHDERAKVTGVPDGRYDLEVAFKGGRVCFVRNVKVEAGKVFSVEDKDLTACNKK